MEFTASPISLPLIYLCMLYISIVYEGSNVFVFINLLLGVLNASYILYYKLIVIYEELF